ncbi:MAG: FRG domain-containing protein [Gemmatimonadaceae bacterium]
MSGFRIPNPILETRVQSWTALLEALHSDDVIPKRDSEGGHYRSSFVFRGMSDSGWPLETSLERLKSPAPVVEPALLRAFRKYAPRGTFARHSDWEALAVAQHNGLPTRLLDWSVSPLIAVHFATVERKHFDKDGVVWCVNVILLRDYVLHPDFGEPLRRAPAAVFDVALLEQAYRGLTELDDTASTLGEACLFFEPPSLDARIANQQGILSMMNGSELSHQAYFQKGGAARPGISRRIIIDKAAKSQIRDMLDQNNIHERLLFPGLPGLCDWLKRYYGPA